LAYGSISGLKWSSGWTLILFGGLALAIVFGTWAGAVAAGKGRNAQAWFLIGFFVPVAGVVAAYIARPRDSA